MHYARGQRENIAQLGDPKPSGVPGYYWLREVQFLRKLLQAPDTPWAERGERAGRPPELRVQP